MTHYRQIILCLSSLQLVVVCGSLCQSTNDERHQLINRLQHFRDLPDEIVVAALDSADVRVQREDTLVLSALFDMTAESDGYVSELLGAILGNLFLQRTEFFLHSLLTRTREQQSDIASMAFYMDGGGMSSHDFQQIEVRLRAVQQSKEQNLAELARICLSALQAGRKEVQN